MTILGISCYYHDAAAALLVDGKVIAAAQEERFTRVKHDPGYPENAIAYCLKAAGISSQELDIIALYDKPLLKFERLLETYLAFAPAGIRSAIAALPVWIKQKLWISEHIRTELGFEGKMVFPEHHESHAASAFFPSPFNSAAILTMDGVGEWATASFGTGEGNQIEISHEMHFPHSLGLLYSAFTYYTGFRVNSGEYKVMGLAPYGEPVYARKIIDELLDLKEDGSFGMDMSYFNYCAGLRMTNRKFDKLFGGPPRKPETPIGQREMDLAASIQLVTETIMLKMARHVKQVTGKNNLCMAGGVALNSVGNGKILKEGLFDNIWVQPAAGDSGTALGAALFAWHQYLGTPRTVSPDGQDSMQGSLLGPSFSSQAIKEFLDKQGCHYEVMDESTLAKNTARHIADGKVVGWFQGRMEFGPRALGNRSILGDPRSPEMQKKLNLKIKFREGFRPFAPSVMKEHAGEYFDLDGTESPYMLLVVDVAADKLIKPETKETGFDQLHQLRSVLPAITHVDNSARVQTVDEQTNPVYYGLLKAFNELTGCPVLINTSFNVRGEPIVCTPQDAWNCFIATDMDLLVLGNYIMVKQEQPAGLIHKKPQAEYQLD